jgi:hypothetical protein
LSLSAVMGSASEPPCVISRLVLVAIVPVAKIGQLNRNKSRLGSKISHRFFLVGCTSLYTGDVRNQSSARHGAVAPCEETLRTRSLPNRIPPSPRHSSSYRVQSSMNCHCDNPQTRLASVCLVQLPGYEHSGMRLIFQVSGPRPRQNHDGDVSRLWTFQKKQRTKNFGMTCCVGGLARI